LLRNLLLNIRAKKQKKREKKEVAKMAMTMRVEVSPAVFHWLH